MFLNLTNIRMNGLQILKLLVHTLKKIFSIYCHAKFEFKCEYFKFNKQIKMSKLKTYFNIYDNIICRLFPDFECFF